MCKSSFGDFFNIKIIVPKQAIADFGLVFAH